MVSFLVGFFVVAAVITLTVIAVSFYRIDREQDDLLEQLEQTKETFNDVAVKFKDVEATCKDVTETFDNVTETFKK